MNDTYCEVHNVPFVPDVVPVFYGLFRLPPGFINSHGDFPNSHRWCFGGCGWHWRPSAQVRYCPRCREAEKRWRTEHGETFLEGARTLGLAIEQPGPNRQALYLAIRRSISVTPREVTALLKSPSIRFAAATEEGTQDLRERLESFGATVSVVENVVAPVP